MDLLFPPPKVSTVSDMLGFTGSRVSVIDPMVIERAPVLVPGQPQIIRQFDEIYGGIFIILKYKSLGPLENEPGIERYYESTSLNPPKTIYLFTRLKFCTCLRVNGFGEIWNLCGSFPPCRPV